MARRPGFSSSWPWTTAAHPAGATIGRRPCAEQFGTVPLDDQVAGLKALAAKHPQMDLGHVGVVGWSFGGYMAALAVLKRPDVFHAAVAGAPVCDWEDYDTHYTERYLGLPADRRLGLTATRRC